MYEFKVFKDKPRNNQEKTQFIVRLLAQGPHKNRDLLKRWRLIISIPLLLT